MRLVLDTEQLQLRAALREFLADQAPSASVRETMESRLGYDPELWRRMAVELGVAGLTVPERFGGAGAGHVERAIVAEELGRVLVPSPFLATSVLASDVLLALGDERANRDLLPRMVSGELVVAVAVGAHWDRGGAGAVGSRDGDGWRLDGHRTAVVAGDVAEVLLVHAATDTGPRWFQVDPTGPGVRRTTLHTLDPTRRLAKVEFGSAPAEALAETTRDATSALELVADLAGVMVAAEQLGGLERALWLTVEYAKARVQFGRPIGSYQAVKHGCADMYCDWEQGASAVRYAAWAADHAPDELPVAAALAQSYLGPAYFRAATATVQYHGGIGYTWEHDAHLYYKRAKSTELLFGPPSTHRARLADRLGI